jgi:hypothetical protein
MEIQGKVIQLLPSIRLQSGKSKCGFVIETGGQYPQRIPFDVWGDEKWEAMQVRLGEFVSVSFDLIGREFNGKYFVNLTAWKVVHIGGGASAAAGPSSQGGGDARPF